MTTTAATTHADQSGTTFPFNRGCPFSSPKEYEKLSSKGGVHKVTLATGLQIWAVTGWNNTRQLLTDTRTSASRKHDNFPFYFEAPPEFRTDTSFIGFDAPEHSATRRLAAVTFTNRRVQMLRPRIQEIVDNQLDVLEGLPQPADFHHNFSLPVPMTVICELLGIPYEDHQFFQENGTILLGGQATREERRAAMMDVGDYLEKLVHIKRANLDDGLLSRAILETEKFPGKFTDRDLVNLCRLLMNGGHETTASMLSLGTACLLENPDQLREMIENPSLVPKAVDELVRYITIGDAAIPRVATEDIELGGSLIKKGDGILCLGLTANRDPSVYENPDKLILSRGDRSHLGFGHGLHHCIGADLARVEMEIVWSSLFQRFPNLQLGRPMSEIPAKEAAIIFGLWELPVTW